jgi:predicted metalloprotease
MKCFAMRTIQISIGELIEAVYEELVEQYGDRELALVAAQAVGDDLMQRLTPKAPAAPSGN